MPGVLGGLGGVPLPQSADHPRHSPRGPQPSWGWGAGAGAGGAKPQQGERQDEGKYHPQKQLSFLIKPVASVSARCSFPFALAQPH